MEQIYLLRKEIDKCDKELVQILQRRMELVMEILENKRKDNLPVLHPQREKEVIEKALSSLDQGDFHKEVEHLLKEILKISRKLQSKKLFPFNIVLVGFMGVGKSSIGNKLSESLEMEVLDTDAMIEEKMGMSITDIFEKQGEEFFRKIERNVIKELSTIDNTILSCGGGVVLDKENVINLKKNGRIILLQAEPTTIYERIKQDNTRPILNGAKSLENIKELLKRRDTAYKESADIIIKTDNQTLEEISTEIIVKLYDMDKYCSN